VSLQGIAVQRIGNRTSTLRTDKSSSLLHDGTYPEEMAEIVPSDPELADQ
jgi:hypothetical protein